MIALRLQLVADARTDDLGAHDLDRLSAPSCCLSARLDLRAGAVGVRRRRRVRRRRACTVYSRRVPNCWISAPLKPACVDRGANVVGVGRLARTAAASSVPPVNSML